MSTWKTLRDEKPDWRRGRILVLTRGNKIESAWWIDGKFYSNRGLVKPIYYKRWCYESDLVKEILGNINKS